MSDRTARNRDNAARSTGPRTESGKAVASKNALKHGVRAIVTVVPGLERQEDWEAHQAAVLRAIVPEGGIETALAERVASILWRLQRLLRYETDMTSIGYDRSEEDFIESRRAVASFGEDVHPSDLRVAVEIARSTRRALERLQAPTDSDAPIDADVARATFRALGRAAQMCESEEEEGLDPEELSYEGLPDDIAIDDFTGWNLPILIGVLRSLADAVSTSPAALLAQALERSRLDERQAVMKRQGAERDLDRFRRSRSIAPAAILERVARYEAHLDRLLQRTLHEIQRLQAMRIGVDVPPPSAVDVTVDGAP